MVSRPAAAASDPSADRPTVGVLVDWLKDLYQSAVFAGLVDAARSRDVNLTVFARRRTTASIVTSCSTCARRATSTAWC
jgi:hypothetical protein